MIANMSERPARFRRPASLFDSTAEAIEGAPDPSTRTELAHHSAAALLDGALHTSDPDVVERVVTLVREEGLEDLAMLWSGSPAQTLPGALWRLYVLHTWVHAQGEDVVHRYREGAATVPGLRYLAGFAEPPDAHQVSQTLDEILRGAFTGDLALALARAGAVAVICAHGTAHLADRAASASAQEELTTQAGRLLTTGEDLAAAARLADRGTLE